MEVPIGKKSTKTSSTTTMPAWARSHATGAAAAMQNAVSANQPHAEEMAGGIRSQLPHLREKVFGDSPALGAAQGYGMDVLGGKYLNGNPHLQGMIDQTGESVMNRVNSLWGGSGRSMSAGHAGAMTGELADAENRLRYGDYSQERSHMANAMGQMSGLHAAQFSGVPAYLGAAQTANELPLAGPSAGLGVGGLWSGQGTTTGKQPGGWGTALLGGLAAAVPFIPGYGKSDRRLKTNIELVGNLSNGLGVYEWNYRQDMGEDVPEGRYRGFMADEIAKVLPWMLGPTINGYMTVRYTPERVGE